MLAKSRYQNLWWCFALTIAPTLLGGCCTGFAIPTAIELDFSESSFANADVCPECNQDQSARESSSPLRAAFKHRIASKARVPEFDEPRLPGHKSRFLPVPTRNVFSPAAYISEQVAEPTFEPEFPVLEPVPMPAIEELPSGNEPRQPEPDTPELDMPPLPQFSPQAMTKPRHEAVDILPITFIGN